MKIQPVVITLTGIPQYNPFFPVCYVSGNNWITIQKQYKYILQLQAPLIKNGIEYTLEK